MKVNFLWVNFSGSNNGDLWESGFSIYHALYDGQIIGESHAICGCGACKSCDIQFDKVNKYHINLKDITYQNKMIDYCVFVREFYNLLEKVLCQTFNDENIQLFGSNIIIYVETSIDIPQIIIKFIDSLKSNGYHFIIDNPDTYQKYYGTQQNLPNSCISYYLNNTENTFPLQLDKNNRQLLIGRLNK